MNNSSADPILMYLVVNQSLGMSVGKTAAQVGHCVQMIMEAYCDLWCRMEYDPGTDKEQTNAFIMRDWCKGSYAKVVLAADDKEWLKLKEELKDDVFLVKDNGLTELTPGSETVIGFFPMHKSQRPKIIKKLQLLK